MKILFKILTILLFTQVSFGQEMNSIIEKTISLNIPYAVNDEGHWFGIRIGTQTKPSNLKRDWKYYEWWTFIASYEYRFDRTFSLSGEYHHFNEKPIEGRDIERIAVEVGLKSRLNILHKLRLSVEGGLAISSIYPALLLLYGGSLEYEINKKIAIYFNIRTFINPDFGYWITIGINYKLFNL